MKYFRSLTPHIWALNKKNIFSIFAFLWYGKTVLYSVQVPYIGKREREPAFISWDRGFVENGVSEAFYRLGRTLTLSFSGCRGLPSCAVFLSFVVRRHHVS